MTLKRLASKRTLVVGLAMLAVAVGSGVAIAAAKDTFDPKAERAAFDTAVAKKLGVTTQELRDAVKAAELERLDAAVAAGRITEEQAELMRSRIESGVLGGPMGFMGGPGMHGGGKHLGTAAEYLGLEVTALVERLRAGESLADVAKAQGKSVDGLDQAILADAKERLDQAVKDGRITADQRDAMLERLEGALDDIVSGTGPMMGPGMRGFGMHGGGFGMHGGGFGMGGPPDA